MGAGVRWSVQASEFPRKKPPMASQKTRGLASECANGFPVALVFGHDSHVHVSCFADDDAPRDSSAGGTSGDYGNQL